MSGVLWLGRTSSLAGSALELAVRSSIFLTIVLVAWWLLGRRSPLIGSLIGQVGLLGLLVLPPSAWLWPPLPIRVLEPLPAPPMTLPLPAEGVAGRDDDEIARPRFPFGDELARLSSTPTGAGGTVPKTELPRPPTRPPSPARARIEIAPGTILVAIYAAGVLAWLSRLVGSLVGIHRLVGSSVPVVDPAWTGALRELRGRLGIVRPVALVRSARVGMPVVAGWLRPTILLPLTSSAADPIEHAEAILLHELAHVRRGDYAWNVLLRLVEAVYWPHPLAWLLGRAVADSREMACDAFCVHEMGGPTSYRASLLAMAEVLTRPSPALGLTMTGRSRLGRRVAAINRTRGVPRCLPRWPVRVAAAVVGIALATVLGPAQITSAEVPRRPATILASAVPAQEPPRPTAPARAPAAGRVFRLRVVSAETGKPVRKAQVRLWLKLADEDWRETDEEGRLDIAYATGPDDRRLSLDTWGDGFAMQRHSWGDDPKVPAPDEATVKLQPGESLGGLVRDEEGHPVPGATVYLWSHNYKRKDSKELLFDLRAVTGPDGRWHTGGAPQTSGEILGFYITHADFVSDREYVAGREKPPIADLRAGSAVSTLKKGAPIEGRVLAPDGQPVAGALVISTEQPGNLFNGLAKFAVATDAAGRFRTGQVKPGDWHLVVRARGFAPTARDVTVGTAILNEEIRLNPPHPFRARVVDPSGSPVEGAFVNIDTWRGYRCLGVYLYSDADGRVRWDDAPEDNLTVNVDREGYVGLFQERVKAGSDLTFTIQPALSISGIVRDAATKKAVERATIEYGAVNPATGDVATWQPQPELGWVWFASGHLTARFPVAADAYKIRITAEGYQAFVSRTFRREEQVVRDYDVALTPGRSADQPFATAIRPDGRPLAGARIARGGRRRNLSLQDGNFGDASGETSADGTFAIPPAEDDVVLILGDDCFAYANARSLLASRRLQARSYARIEGRFLVGDWPLANRSIELSGHIQDESTSFGSFFYGQKATTDADGRFAFEKVIPMSNLRVGRRNRPEVPGGVSSIGEAVRVEDGQTATITVGGQGRAVVGRVEPPEGWTQPVDFSSRSNASIRTDRTNNPYPLELMRGKTSLSDPGWSEWLRSWPRTAEGRAYADARFATTVQLGPDGSFRVDDVPPGEHRVTIRVAELTRPLDRGPFAAMTRTFEVPSIAGGRADEPLDLGVLRLRVRSRPKAGDPAPRFEVRTVAGNKLTVPDDFAGKLLLLDFGTLWDDQSRLQVVRLNDVFARFGKDERFAMLSLLMAADRDESRAFVAEKGQPWTQAVAGPIDNPITDAYGIEDSDFPGDFPAAVLVGPDGRILAPDLRYQAIGEAVGKALAPPGPEKPRGTNAATATADPQQRGAP